MFTSWMGLWLWSKWLLSFSLERRTYIARMSESLATTTTGCFRSSSIKRAVDASNESSSSVCCLTVNWLFWRWSLLISTRLVLLFVLWRKTFGLQDTFMILSKRMTTYDWCVAGNCCSGVLSKSHHCKRQRCSLCDIGMFNILHTHYIRLDKSHLEAAAYCGEDDLRHKYWVKWNFTADGHMWSTLQECFC